MNVNQIDEQVEALKEKQRRLGEAVIAAKSRLASAKKRVEDFDVDLIDTMADALIHDEKLDTSAANELLRQELAAKQQEVLAATRAQQIVKRQLADLAEQRQQAEAKFIRAAMAEAAAARNAARTSVAKCCAVFSVAYGINFTSDRTLAQLITGQGVGVMAIEPQVWHQLRERELAALIAKMEDMDL